MSNDPLLEMRRFHEDYTSKLELVIELRDKFYKVKFNFFNNRIKTNRKLKQKISELYKSIIELDRKMIPFLDVNHAIRDGEPQANKVIGLKASRDLLLSNLKKLEQDISNFENQQNFKKSLFIAVIALVVSIITTIPNLIEIIKPLFSS